LTVRTQDNASEVFTTRVKHTVNVYPSLDIHCAIRPNPREGSPFVLGVEVRFAFFLPPLGLLEKVD
jgi:hypothetical protein